jgi:hypothetical protein
MMHTCHFTRLTNAFSKKVENHVHSVALFAMYCNFVRIHSNHTLFNLCSHLQRWAQRLHAQGGLIGWSVAI